MKQRDASPKVVINIGKALKEFAYQTEQMNNGNPRTNT